MTAYSNSDAARDLRLTLDKAPSGAVKGEWFLITEQAGVSSQSGGYIFTDGSYVAADNHAFERVRENRVVVFPQQQNPPTGFCCWVRKHDQQKGLGAITLVLYEF